MCTECGGRVYRRSTGFAHQEHTLAEARDLLNLASLGAKM